METFISEIAYDVSQETWPFDMTIDTSLISDDEDDTHPNIDTPSLFRWRHQARVEKMEEAKKEKETLSTKHQSNQQKIQQMKQKIKESEKNYSNLMTVVIRKIFLNLSMRLEEIMGLQRKFPYPSDPHLSEEVNALRQMLMELNRNSVAFEEMSQYISEVIENIKRNRLMEKLFIFLLAFLLHYGNSDCKHLARPERRKISCINVYLLGNDGAHSYNGNGNCLYTQSTDEESWYLILPANLPLDVLQRQPTDREIARMSGKIGQKYHLLAYELGLTRVQFDHLMLDYPTTLLRIQRMFFIWRDQIEGNATFEILVNAMVKVGINPDIVCQCLERA